jgi:salicylate biosynthesis isochorismate synthase
MAEHTHRWMRVQEAMTDMDPWTVLHPLQEDGVRLMAWSSPQQETCFVAAGVIQEYRPMGDARFAQARDWWKPIAASMLTIDGDGHPVDPKAPGCLAGFAFSSREQRSDHWKAWGDGALCLPEVLIWRSDGQTWAVYTVDTSVHSLTERLPLLRSMLMDWKRRAVSTMESPANGTVMPLHSADDARETWKSNVKAAQATMATGSIQKIVLARAQAYRPDDTHSFDPLATAWALRKRQVDSTTFLIRRKDGQAFLGSSPEVLARLESGQVETVALAGTRRRSDTSTDDEALGTALMESTKDRHEQQLVAQAIEQALSSMVSNLQGSDTPDVVRHPDVQHLRTTIRGSVTLDATIFDLVDQLHPTPAVGGLPREHALQWLDLHEHLDRGWYAGPIGWIAPSGDGEFVVAIRSVLMADDQAAAFAGCGLVASSNPADEWEESQIKLQTVRQGLAYQAGIES